jgi:N-acetylmuramoyl-L-alanine amidase
MIAICVGHSRPGDRGASSIDGTSEHAYNLPLAIQIALELCRREIQATVFDSYTGATYGQAMRWLADQIRQANATAAIELHFNAATGDARGSEWLYWHSSAASQSLATSFRTAHTAAFPWQPCRGIKPRDAEDRGALFLRYTHCPAIICEPFFGDNPAEWSLFSQLRDQLALACATALADWIA